MNHMFLRHWNRCLLLTGVFTGMLLVGLISTGHAQDKAEANLDSNGVPISFYQQCRDRFLKNTAAEEPVDFMTAAPIAKGEGYQILPEDFKRSQMAKALYLHHYKEKMKLSDSDAEQRYRLIVDLAERKPQMLIFVKDNLDLFLPNPPMGDMQLPLLKANLKQIEGTDKKIRVGSIDQGFFEVDEKALRKAIEGIEQEQLGDSYTRMGKHQEALDAYVAALKCNPNEWILYMNIGVCYGRLGKIDVGVKYLEQTLLFPKCDEARVKRNMRGMKGE